MIPLSYFYLVDFETDEPLAIFSAAECPSGLEQIALEARIRIEHNVDDVSTGLALRDSGSAPLPVETAERVLCEQARRKHIRPR